MMQRYQKQNHLKVLLQKNNNHYHHSTVLLFNTDSNTVQIVYF